MPDFDLDASLAPPPPPDDCGSLGPTGPGLTWRERLCRRWFPSTSRLPPTIRARFEEQRRDVGLPHMLYIHATTWFSWRDRLRVLLSGRVMSVVVVATQNPVGMHLVETQAYPLPPKLLAGHP